LLLTSLLIMVAFAALERTRLESAFHPKLTLAGLSPTPRHHAAAAPKILSGPRTNFRGPALLPTICRN
jgi:hypothetical protein